MTFALSRPDPDTLVFRERRNWILVVFPLFVLPPFYSVLFGTFTDPSAAWDARVAAIRGEPILMAFFAVPLLFLLPAVFALFARRNSCTVDRSRREVSSRGRVLARFDDVVRVRLTHLVHRKDRLWHLELELGAGGVVSVASTGHETALLAGDEIADMMGVPIRAS